MTRIKVLCSTSLIAACVAALCLGCTKNLPPLDRVDDGPRYGESYEIAGLNLTLLWIEELQCWVAQTEVTNDQFREFRVSHFVRRFQGKSLMDADQPAVQVSYEAAEEFLTWLNIREELADRLPRGWGYKLPNAKQWRFCAIDPDQNRALYPWGDGWPPPQGNFGDASARLSGKSNLGDYDDGFPVSCAVMDSGQNLKGFYGMSGNAFEWVDDWYTSRHNRRLLLGGSWRSSDRLALESKFRAKNRPSYKSDEIGFRIILSYHGSQL